jgi:hypothetical protein
MLSILSAGTREFSPPGGTPLHALAKIFPKSGNFFGAGVFALLQPIVRKTSQKNGCGRWASKSKICPASFRGCERPLTLAQ